MTHPKQTGARSYILYICQQNMNVMVVSCWFTTQLLHQVSLLLVNTDSRRLQSLITQIDQEYVPLGRSDYLIFRDNSHRNHHSLPSLVSFLLLNLDDSSLESEPANEIDA